jgi:uncharacterized protein (DUF1810 family)
MKLDGDGLGRFIEAQRPVYADVLDELGAGTKRSHWMWFIFPQLRGLGVSVMARHFGLSDADEARAYLAHPLLGARLRECVGLVLAVEGKSAFEIFAAPDDLKFRSCMTLFDRVAPEERTFAEALRRYFGGRPDERTLSML